jgi:hypothetical protein
LYGFQCARIRAPTQRFALESAGAATLTTTSRDTPTRAGYGYKERLLLRLSPERSCERADSSKQNKSNEAHRVRRILRIRVTTEARSRANANRARNKM